MLVLFFCFALFLSPLSHGRTTPAREIEALTDRVRRDPGDVSAWSRLGEILWEGGARRKAVKYFRKANRIDREYPPPYYSLGKAYFFEKKPAKGVEYFGIFEGKMDRFLEDNPGYLDYYVHCLKEMNILYLAFNRYDDAVKRYKKMLRLKPDDPGAHYNLAVCYYKYYHNRPSAYRELQKVIETDKNTGLSDRARFFIEYMRNNPDSRYMEDFGFIEE